MNSATETEESDIVKLLKPPEFKEMQKRLREVSTLFKTLTKEQSVECKKALSGFLMGPQGEVEVHEITEQIPIWFPILASETQEELTECALALINYYANRINTDYSAD